MKNLICNLKPAWQRLIVLQFLALIVLGSLQAQATVTENQMKTAINELTEATKVVFRNSDVRKEVFYLANNSFYYDRYVGLPDLMAPQTSPLYVSAAVPAQFKGVFKNSITSLVNSNPALYPTISQFFNAKSTQMGDNYPFLSKANLYFYIPYVEDYEVNSFDPVIVPSLEEADVTNGYIKNREGTGYMLFQGVNDDYAALNPTVIITPEDYKAIVKKADANVQDSGTRSSCCVAHSCCENNIRQVHCGWGRLDKQMDPLVSLSGNGGGSEMRWLRVYGQAETLPNGNINMLSSATVASKDYSRRDIRKNYWKWWADLWNPDWDCDEVSCVVLIFEHDNGATITKTFSAKVNFEKSLNATVGLGGGSSEGGASTSPATVGVTANSSGSFEGNIGITVTMSANDEPLVQQTREEDEFFVTNSMDQGCGMRNGSGSYNGINHPVLSCGNFKYNLPNRCIERQQ